MEYEINDLPTDIQESWKIILFLHEKVGEISEQYENLQHQVLNLIRGKYGKKSEKLSNEYYVGDLFSDEQLSEPPAKPEIEKISYTRKKSRNGHRKIPEDLPRVRIEYKLTEEELSCPCGCGNKLHKIEEIIRRGSI